MYAILWNLDRAMLLTTVPSRLGSIMQHFMENPVKNIIEIKFRGKISGEIFKYITIIISGVKSASGKNSSV